MKNLPGASLQGKLMALLTGWKILLGTMGFVFGRTFQPGILFLSKAGAYPSKEPFRYQDKLLASLIGLGRHTRDKVFLSFARSGKRC